MIVDRHERFETVQQELHISDIYIYMLVVWVKVRFRFRNKIDNSKLIDSIQVHYHTLFVPQHLPKYVYLHEDVEDKSFGRDSLGHSVA